MNEHTPMNRWTVWQVAASVMVGTLAAMSACNARRADAPALPSGGQAIAAASRGDTVYRLTLRSPEIRHELRGDSAALATAKFVAIEVENVVNPGRLSLSFELRFVPSPGDLVVLGTVTLFPADNPGQFIIPTSGKLHPNGVLMLRMLTPDSGSAGDAVRVAVRIALRNK